MTASGVPDSWPRGLQQGLGGRWAVALFVAALVYAGAAMMTAPHVGVAVRGFLFPLRLFLIAIAPTIAGVAFLWSDRAIDDERRRRLTRILVLMVCGFVGLAAMGWGP
jgi:hypothetical protein